VATPNSSNDLFIKTLEAASGLVPADAKNIERRLKMRATLNQIWEAWIRKPELRLGQLIMAATSDRYDSPGECSLGRTSDEVLVTLVQEYTQ
jgi:hypothetical protein